MHNGLYNSNEMVISRIKCDILATICNYFQHFKKYIVSLPM